MHAHALTCTHLRARLGKDVIYAVASADREGGEAPVQEKTVTSLDSRHILAAKQAAARLKSTCRAAFVQARLPLACDELKSSVRPGDPEKQTHTLCHAHRAVERWTCLRMGANVGRAERASDGPSGWPPAHAPPA